MKFSNPQALAAVSTRKSYKGVPELGIDQDRDTWLTPRYILDQIGLFDLDPCAAASNPLWTGAKVSITVLEDGLSKPWIGRAFVNPPFSNTIPWLRRHSEHGNGITLVPASVESNAWRTIVWRHGKAVLFIHGRTRFCNPDGSITTGRPLRSIALIAWSDFDTAILKACDLAGTFVSHWGIK